MRLKLADNREMRTVIVRIKSEKQRPKLFAMIYNYKHFENMLLILIKQNYDLAQQQKSENDFSKLSSYQVMRAVIRDTDGGKHKEAADYIKKKYKDNQLMQSLIAVGRNLKVHNLAMIIGRVKGNFKSFFSHLKQNHQEAKPPRPKKLSKVKRFSVPLDFNAWSFKRKDKVGINLRGKMFYLHLKHKKLEEVITSISRIQSVSLLSTRSYFLNYVTLLKLKAIGICFVLTKQYRFG